MKKTYTKPEAEMIEFDYEDVVTASGSHGNYGDASITFTKASFGCADEFEGKA